MDGTSLRNKKDLQTQVWKQLQNSFLKHSALNFPWMPGSHEFCMVQMWACHSITVISIIFKDISSVLEDQCPFMSIPYLLAHISAIFFRPCARQQLDSHRNTSIELFRSKAIIESLVLFWPKESPTQFCLVELDTFDVCKSHCNLWTNWLVCSNMMKRNVLCCFCFHPYLA